MSGAVANGEARLLAKCFDAIADGSMISGWFATADWAKKNPVTAKRFVQAIYQSGSWANANRERSGRILQKYSKISDATLHAMTRVVYAQSLEPAMVNPTRALAAANKFTDRLVSGSDVIEKI